MEKGAPHMTSVQVDKQHDGSEAVGGDAPDEGYQRGLGSRQVQMIAIGGAIGIGLFLGAGAKHRQGRPQPDPRCTPSRASIIFFIMRALGELLLYRPVSGSFAEYAREFLGPFFGYFTGWTYWLMWVVTGMAEVTAAAIYVHYWFPAHPAVGDGPGLPGRPVRRQPDLREALRRARVLVLDGQGHRPRSA